MFRKAFVALCLAGLAALCAGETFVVHFKPFPCDFEFITKTTTPTGESTSSVKYHGNYAIETDGESVSI